MKYSKIGKELIKATDTENRKQAYRSFQNIEKTTPRTAELKSR